MILGVLAGLALALTGLIPGLHPAAMMLSVFPLLGAESALVAGGVAVGAGTVLSILHSTYHPVAENLLAHADIAAKMAYDGRGKSAVWVHRLACEQALNLVILLGGFFGLVALAGANWLAGLIKLIDWVSPVVLLLILATIAIRAKRFWRTGLVMVLAGILGFVSMHAAATKGHEWSLAALLAGMFTLPAAWGLWKAKTPKLVPDSQPAVDEDDDPVGFEFTGGLLGVLTGFLAGVSTGSLVSLLRRDDMPDVHYIGLASGAEMANGAWALVMMALVGSSRSGVAVAAGEAGVAADPWIVFILLAALIVGFKLGDRIVDRWEDGYRQRINSWNQRRMGKLLFAFAIGLVLFSGGWVGVVLMGTAWMLSSLAKTWKTPNQALLVALIGPVLLGQLGLLQSMAGVLGL